MILAGRQRTFLEGMKLFEYAALKYGWYFTTGFLKLSAVSCIALYAVLHQEVVTQSDIVDALQTVRPFTASTLEVAASDSLKGVWWNTLSGSCVVPHICILHLSDWQSISCLESILLLCCSEWR